MYAHVIIKMYGRIRKGDMLKGSKKENGKTKRIYLRVTENEYKTILEKANKKNMTMSKYILYLVEKDKK